MRRTQRKSARQKAGLFVYVSGIRENSERAGPANFPSAAQPALLVLSAMTMPFDMTAASGEAALSAT
ncbi:MAG: hypothetical protein ABJB01_03055 [Rudaea sp.]